MDSRLPLIVNVPIGDSRYTKFKLPLFILIDHLISSFDNTAKITILFSICMN
jgi:hypothetical protein